MGTTWSERRKTKRSTRGNSSSGLLDRGAEKWAAMRANPVKADFSAGPIESKSDAAPAAAPKPSRKLRYY